MADQIKVYEESDNVFIIEFTTPEARINPDFIKEFGRCLDVVDKHNGPTALVITNTGKFFSNGLKFEALAEDPEGLLNAFHALMARLLSFGCPTIAALNGHAFAGGAMMAFCCDYRIMNEDKGFICVNEVDINLPLPPAMARIVTHKVNRTAWPRMILNAHRFSGAEALKEGIVSAIVPSDKLRATALGFAAKLAHRGENKANYTTLKEIVYKDALADMRGGDLGPSMKVFNQMRSKL